MAGCLKTLGSILFIVMLIMALAGFCGFEFGFYIGPMPPAPSADPASTLSSTSTPVLR